MIAFKPKIKFHLKYRTDAGRRKEFVGNVVAARI